MPVGVQSPQDAQQTQQVALHGRLPPLAQHAEEHCQQDRVVHVRSHHHPCALADLCAVPGLSMLVRIGFLVVAASKLSPGQHRIH